MSGFTVSVINFRFSQLIKFLELFVLVGHSVSEVSRLRDHFIFYRGGVPAYVESNFLDENRFCFGLGNLLLFVGIGILHAVVTGVMIFG